MSIAFFIENYRRGGLEKVFLSQISKWPKEKDKLVVYCNNVFLNDSDLNKFTSNNLLIKKYNSPYDRLFIRKKNTDTLIFKILYNIFYCYILMFFEIFYFTKKFKEENINGIFIHNGGWPGSRISRSVAIAAKFAKVKNIFIVIHNLAQKKNPLIYIQETIIEIILKILKINIISVSNAVKNSLKKRTFLSHSKTIYNGIQIPIAKPNENFKSIHGIDGYKIITMIGTFELRRGHHILFKSFAQIAKFIPKTKLLIIGTGSEKEKKRINKLIDLNNLRSHIILLGYKEDVANIINISDLIVNPVTEFESFGLVALECMALKKLILSSDVGGTSEVIIDNKTGFLFRAGDTKQLSEKMLYLMNNTEGQKKIALSGYQRYINNFTDEKMIYNYNKLIDN